MSSFLLKKKEKKTFEEKIRKLSRKTQESIRAVNNSFGRFCIDHYDSRLSEEIFEELSMLKGSEQLEASSEVLQSWIDWLYDDGILTTSVKQYVSKIKKSFHHNGIKIHFEDFDEPLEFKPRIKEELHELTLEEIQKIFSAAKYHKKGFYLALISTGCRPGKLLQVRKRDINTTQKRIKIRIEAENVKTRSGRSVWLTKEAESYLMTRIKDLDEDDLVWATNENFSYAEKNESGTFNRYTDKVGLNDKYKSNGYRKITLYSFRSYFFGRAADIHREGYAHRMTGHGGYLPQYDRMSEAKRLGWFLKLEPELLIDNTRREKIKNQQLEAEKTGLSKCCHLQQITLKVVI